MYTYNDETFVVLENILDVPQVIHKIYDIKGSTQGRTNTTGEGILKDLDVTEPLNFGVHRNFLLEQINKDSKVISLTLFIYIFNSFIL